jgi:hypothetical protein
MSVRWNTSVAPLVSDVEGPYGLLEIHRREAHVSVAEDGLWVAEVPLDGPLLQDELRTSCSSEIHVGGDKADRPRKQVCDRHDGVVHDGLVLVVVSHDLRQRAEKVDGDVLEWPCRDLDAVVWSPAVPLGFERLYVSHDRT